MWVERGGGSFHFTVMPLAEVPVRKRSTLLQSATQLVPIGAPLIGSVRCKSSHGACRQPKRNGPETRSGCVTASPSIHSRHPDAPTGRHSCSPTKSEVCAAALPLVALSSLGRREHLQATTCRFLPPSRSNNRTATTCCGGFRRQAEPRPSALPMALPSIARWGNGCRSRILLAEDLAINQRADDVRCMGYRADVAKNGLEVLQPNANPTMLCSWMFRCRKWTV